MAPERLADERLAPPQPAERNPGNQSGRGPDETMSEDRQGQAPSDPATGSWTDVGPPPGLPPGFDPLHEQVVGWSRTSAPGLAMMVLGIVSALFNVGGLVVLLVGVGLLGPPAGSSGPGSAGGLPSVLLTGFSNVLSATLGLLLNGVTIAGGVCMRRQRSYGLAVAGAICAVIPCGNICCVASLPIGIWALSVLSDASIRSSFR